MLAGPSPEALIGPIASATERIRVGSGGVMLPHYSPFKVAETFSVLAGLYPGRIDLGLGRAAGTDPMTTHALQRDRSAAMPDDFPQQLAELLAYFDGTIPSRARSRGWPKVLPGRPGDARAVAARLLAAERGLGRRARPPLRVRGLHQPAGAEIAALYRREFADGVRLDAPQTSVAVWALAADSEEEASRLADEQPDGVHDAAPRPPDRGPAAGDRERFLGARATGSSPRRRTIVGTPDQVRAGIEAAAAEYGAEEVIVVTITYDHEARRRSYELIAAEFDLTARAPRRPSGPARDAAHCAASPFRAARLPPRSRRADAR